MTHHKHHSSGKAFLHDLAKLTKPIGHTLESGFHSAEKVMTAPMHELGMATRSIGGSLSVPLIIGGVAILFIVMNRR